MCGYQEPEVYVKRFVGRVLSGIESVQFFFEEVRVFLTYALRLIMVLRTSLSRRSLLVGALRIGSK
jgi:hypothetical protein